MASPSAATNAGVHNSAGIEFQKFCAIYLVLSDYTKFKGQPYFICLEHHDDLLFCFQTKSNSIVKIDVYQAKKASKAWTMGTPLFEIIAKLTQTGLDLTADPHPKETTYDHTLSFITNDSITLHCGTTPVKNRKSATLSVSNTPLEYINIDASIQANIKKGLQGLGINGQQQLAQLDKSGFVFIDLPKAVKQQKNTLVGLIASVFSNQVTDPEAALNALMQIFREVETTLNNGNVAKLLDESKRVKGAAIDTAINIITTKAKAYDLWRSKSVELCNTLKIGVFDQDKFKTLFQNSFDLFKDKKQAEHKKILKFVKDNKAKWSAHTDEISCIEDIFNSYKAAQRTSLLDLDLKAVVCAAFIEVKG